jgi:hypothetical protein
MRFGRLLALRKVDVSGDLDACIVGADDRCQDVLDALDNARLDLMDIARLRRIEAGFQQCVFLSRQQGAALVEQGDAGGQQLRDAGGDQILDTGDLGRVERASRVETEQYRRRWLLVLAHEDTRLWNRQVHPRRPHGGDRLDGSRQLTFQAALIIDLFGKLADAELLAFHQLEADGAAARQALRCEAQADIVHPALGNQDRAAGVAELVGDVHLLERSDDCAAIALGDVGEQHSELVLPEPGAGRRRAGRKPRRWRPSAPLSACRSNAPRPRERDPAVCPRLLSRWFRFRLRPCA